MEAPPPSYEDVTRGGGGFYPPGQPSNPQPSAPPAAGEFSQGQPLAGQGQQSYTQAPHGYQHGHPPYGAPNSSSSYGPTSSSGHGAPAQHTPATGGTFPQYTYTTVQAGPGYQYSPAQGVNPLSAGYQTTPLTRSGRPQQAAGQRTAPTRTQLIINNAMKRTARRQRVKTGICIVVCLSIIVILLIVAIVIATTV